LNGNVLSSSGIASALNLGGKSFIILDQAALLLQQAFEAMRDPSGEPKKEGVSDESKKGNAEMNMGKVEKGSKQASVIDVPETSKHGEVRGNSVKMPYCFYCKTKGHAIEVCHTNMYCDICVSHDHVRLRCPMFRAVRLPTVPCGFAVEDLGFFHIQHEQSLHQRNEACSALISVMDGSLNVQNVTSELERLIPGTWKWHVEEVGTNSFETIFPSRAELRRMVEWGWCTQSFRMLS
jgi:hypothetical protein